MNESKTKPLTTSPETTSNWQSVLCLAVVIVAWGVFRLAHPDITDDAFITFKYARNLVEGNGFVFNPGEWILGTTTPIFALFVSVGIYLGFTPWSWVIGWDVVWCGIILWRFQQLFRHYGFERWFPLGAMLVILSSLETLPVSGMETGLYMAAMFSCLSGLARKRPFPAIGAWALLCLLLRPDGAIICVIVAICTLRNWKTLNKRSFWLTTVVCSGILLLYGIVLYFFYGSVLPHSLHSKSGSSIHLPYSVTFTAGMVNLFTDHYHAINLVGIVGAITLLLKRKAFPELSLFVFLYLAFFVFGKAPDFKWYRTPMAVVFSMMAVPGIGLLLEKYSGIQTKSWLIQCAGTVLGMTLLLPQAGIYSRLYYQQAIQWGRCGTNNLYFQEAAEKINELTHGEEGHLVASHEVGALGYFCQYPIYDMEGLVTDRITDDDGNFLNEKEELEQSGANWFVHRFPRGVYPPEHQEKYLRLKQMGFAEEVQFQREFSPYITIVFRKENKSQNTNTQE